jgi:hypothetical protein
MQRRFNTQTEMLRGSFLCMTDHHCRIHSIPDCLHRSSHYWPVSHVTPQTIQLLMQYLDISCNNNDAMESQQMLSHVHGMALMNFKYTWRWTCFIVLKLVNIKLINYAQIMQGHDTAGISLYRDRLYGNL